MNVRCHRSAPPSHPPMANDFGQFSRSLWGILAPKLGNARKICSPLPTMTNREIAFTQWHNRTGSGCSYAARATASVSSSFVRIISTWERLKIGGGTPPILTRHGWLIVYHGVSEVVDPSTPGH